MRGRQQRPLSTVRPVLWAYSLSAAAAALIGTASYVALGLTDTKRLGVRYDNFSTANTMEVIGRIERRFESTRDGSAQSGSRDPDRVRPDRPAPPGLSRPDRPAPRVGGPEAATIQVALASWLTLAMFLDILTNRKQVWMVIGLAASHAHLPQRSRSRQDFGGRMSEAPDAGLFAGTQWLSRDQDIDGSRERR